MYTPQKFNTKTPTVAILKKNEKAILLPNHHFCYPFITFRGCIILFAFGFSSEKTRGGNSAHRIYHSLVKGLSWSTFFVWFSGVVCSIPTHSLINCRVKKQDRKNRQLWMKCLDPWNRWLFRGFVPAFETLAWTKGILEVAVICPSHYSPES